MHTELQSTIFFRVCSINLWAISWKLLQYHLLSVLVTAKLGMHLHLRLCVLQNTVGAEVVRNCLGSPVIIQNSLFSFFFFFKEGGEKAVSNQFWCCEGVPQFMLCTHHFTQTHMFSKSPIHRNKGMEIRDLGMQGSALVLLGMQRRQQHFSPWLSLLEMTARLLLCPSHDTAISEAISEEKSASFTSPCSLCPSSSGWQRWGGLAQQLPIFPCQVEMDPITFMQAGFTLAMFL